MKNMNLAFMAKLGWRLLTEPYKLWAKIIQAKFMRGMTEISKFEKKKNSSNAWKGIGATNGVLKQGIRARVYNGAKTC